MESLGLTEAQVAKYRQAFSVYDRDGNGSITTAELGATVKELWGKNPTESELKDMMKKMDRNNSGTIELQEFLATMANRRKRTEAEISDLFKKIDKDGNGVITADELRAAVKGLGGKTGEFDIEQIIKEADKDGDGKVNRAEFFKIMQSK